jgi:hypothetical protein
MRAADASIKYKVLLFFVNKRTNSIINHIELEPTPRGKTQYQESKNFFNIKNDLYDYTTQSKNTPRRGVF